MARKTVEIVPTPAGLSGYIAEIGAALLGAHMHLPQHHILDHAAYIGSWMRVLANDTRAFLYAAGQAQRAVDWLLAKSAITELCDVQA